MTDFFFGQMGGQSLFNVAGLKFEGLKIDWTSVAIDVLLTCFEDNETVQILASLGILYYFNVVTFHDTGYDTYNNMYYMFATLGNWLIPTLNGSDSYGAPSIQGMNPLQFQDWFDATLRVLPGVPMPVINILEARLIYEYLDREGWGGWMEMIPWPVLQDYIPATAITNTYSSFIPIGSKRIGGESTYLSDAAYILCEMDANYCADSYVQRALSQTGIYRGATYEEDYMSQALNAEASKYANFREQASTYGGYVNSIEDLTENAKVLYDRWNESYYFGPFKLDYIRDFSYNDLRGMADFGFIYDMIIYDQDGNEIPQDYWTIQYSDDTRMDRIDYDWDYQFPYPQEPFYIELMNYGDNNIQSISKIEVKYKEMQAQAIYQDLMSFYYQIYWHEIIIPKPTLWGMSWVHRFYKFELPLMNKSAITVDNAVKYYVHHTQTITLHKNPSHGGYETATFTTTSETVTDGRTDISCVNGGKLNSSLRESVTAAYALYKQEHPDKENEEEKKKQEEEQKTQQENMEAAIKQEESRIEEKYKTALAEAGDDKAAIEKVNNEYRSDLRHLESQKLALSNLSSLYKVNNKTTLEKRLESLSPTLNVINNAFTQILNSNPLKDGLEVILKNLNVNKDLMKLYNIYNVVTTQGMSDLTKTVYIANTLIDSKEGKYIISALGTITALANHNGNDILGMMSVIASSLGRNDYANSINNISKLTSDLDSKLSKVILNVSFEALSYTGDDLDKRVKDLINKYGSDLTDEEKAIVYTKSMMTLTYASNNSELSNIKETYKKGENAVEWLEEHIGKKKDENSDNKDTNIENENTTEQKEENDSAWSQGLQFVADIAGQDSSVTKEINKIEDLYRGASTTTKDDVMSTLWTVAQESINGKSREDAIQTAINISMSNKQTNIINDYIKVTDQMDLDQIKELYNQLRAKGTNLDEVSEILTTYQSRLAQMTAEEKAEVETRPYADTLAEVTVLEDNTPYIEYSPKFTITNIERPNEVYWSNDDELGMTIGVAGVVWKDGHGGLETDYDGIRGANANGELELGIEGVKVTLVDRLSGQIGKMYN